MRDIKRIEPYMEKLMKYWKLFPDWRFGQFILNLFSEAAYLAKTDDLFYIEDEELFRYIDEVIAKWTGK